MGRRYLVLGPEVTAFGVPATAWEKRYIRALEDTLQADQQMIYPDDTEHAEQVTAIPGPYLVRGDIGGYAEPYTFGFMLQKALGTWSASTIHAPSTVYTHSIVTTDSDVEYFYAERGHDNVEYAQRFAGLKFENFRLESRMGQPLMWTGTVRGFKDSVVAQIAAADVETGYDTVLQPWMHHNVVLTHDNDTAKVQTFRLNVRHRLADAYYSSRFSEEWDYEGREISGELTLKLTDIVWLQKFYARDGAVKPEDTVDALSLTATYTTGYTFAGQGTWTGLLRFHIPSVHLNTAQIRQRSRETEIAELPFRAIYNRTYNYGIRAVIRTTHGKPL